MKNVYYAIKYKFGNNVFQKMNEYKTSELAEKDCQELNKTAGKSYTYFVELAVDEIINEVIYKGFRIIKRELSLYEVYKMEKGLNVYKVREGSIKACKEFINRILLAEYLFNWQKSIKQYRPYSVSNLIIEKSFNEGKGSLALFRIMPKEKKIKVNSSLATKRDMEYIKDLQKALRLENYELTYKSYYYPEYYSHNF